MNGSAVILDYGVGNLRSVERAVAHCGAKPILATQPDKVDAAERVILPGVGAFADCVSALKESGLRDALLRVLDDGRPVLGICVGMQMLLESSDEFGLHRGLGRLKGAVRAIPKTGADGQPHKIPHIGWSGLHPSRAAWKGTILDGIAPGSACYFLHSYASVPDAPEHTLAVCDYNGLAICAALRVGSTYGVQFHPEKSGPVGLHIMRNFLNL